MLRLPVGACNNDASILGASVDTVGLRPKTQAFRDVFPVGSPQGTWVHRLRPWTVGQILSLIGPSSDARQCVYFLGYLFDLLHELM